jgi:hypothetical protein
MYHPLALIEIQAYRINYYSWSMSKVKSLSDPGAIIAFPDETCGVI